jgi:hypothetical protein
MIEVGTSAATRTRWPLASNDAISVIPRSPQQAFEREPALSPSALTMPTPVARAAGRHPADRVAAMLGSADTEANLFRSIVFGNHDAEALFDGDGELQASASQIESFTERCTP